MKQRLLLPSRTTGTAAQRHTSIRNVQDDLLEFPGITEKTDSFLRTQLLPVLHELADITCIDPEIRPEEPSGSAIPGPSPRAKWSGTLTLTGDHPSTRLMYSSFLLRPMARRHTMR